MLELAEGAGELTLTTDDPAVQPQINCHYLEHPRDRSRLREAVRIGLNIMDHESFKDILDGMIDPTEADLVSDDTLDDWMMRNVWIGQHLSGTCKMGPDSDAMAVVDQYGRVKGLQGLRVADASIMPDCIRANTNLTTIMIGERVADWIRSS
jgi:choline dehydrogenase-like flavoprotein